MIIETWQRHGTRPLPEWCGDHEQQVKPLPKRFVCERTTEAVAKKLEEMFTPEDIYEIVSLLTMKY